MTIADSIIKEVMKNIPQSAEKYIIPTGGSGFKLCIFWKLNSDQERPNKCSKTIAIQISREFIDDFPGHPKEIHNLALTRVGKYVKKKLETFDPNHNFERGSPDPIEEWTLSSINTFE